MPLLPDQLDDFVTLTLNRIKRRNWIDISLDYQKYVFAQRVFANKKVPEKGGTQLDWKVQHQNTGTARNSELYDVDVTAVKDLMLSATVPWTKQTVNFSYDVDEPVFQSDQETIIEEIVIREHSMYNDFFELMETETWTAPTSSTESPRSPYGIPFWIQKDATTTPTGGFNGGDPSGFTAGAAGIATGTYSNWKNWTFGFTNVDRDDFLDRALKAIDYTEFTAPRAFPELKWSKGNNNNKGYYTTHDQLAKMRKLLETRNENLGPDLEYLKGRVLLAGNEVEWVPYLQTNDSTDPFYGINWGFLRYFFQRGRNMRRYRPAPSPGQHTVRRVNMDNWGNFACYNRRTQFVGSTS